MAIKSKNPSNEVIAIPSLPLKVVTFDIVGKTPLLCNRFHPHDQEILQAGQMGKARSSSKIREELDEYEKSMWRVGKGYWFPARSLIASFIGGCRHVDKVTMTGVRGTVSIRNTTEHDGEQLVQIQTKNGPESYSRTVGGSKGSKKAVKTCAMFTDWRITLTCVFDDKILSTEQFMLAWQYAGHYQGIGGWRPNCSGEFGRFELHAK